MTTHIYMSEEERNRSAVNNKAMAVSLFADVKRNLDNYETAVKMYQEANKLLKEQNVELAATNETLRASLAREIERNAELQVEIEDLYETVAAATDEMDVLHQKLILAEDANSKLRVLTEGLGSLCEDAAMNLRAMEARL